MKNKVFSKTWKKECSEKVTVWTVTRKGKEVESEYLEKGKWKQNKDKIPESWEVMKVPILQFKNKGYVWVKWGTLA